MKLKGRTFIISGGSSGLGLATVQYLLNSNAYVSILDRSPPPSTLSAPHAKYFQTDITRNTEIEAAVENTVTWTKETGSPLGGVINCAGIGTIAKILDSRNVPHSLELWDSTLAVNLTGTFNLTRHVLKHLVKVDPEPGDGERGVVILVSSVIAFDGQPGHTAYAATKGALRSMVLPMSRELGRHGVRVVCIAPGLFKSAMTDNIPEKVRKNLVKDAIVYPSRFGLPEEFAGTVGWILECPYVNGETIRLSGAGRLPARL